MINEMDENHSMEEGSEIRQHIEEIPSQTPHVAHYQAYGRMLPNATTTLVLGILSIFICGLGLVFGIIAMLLHKKDTDIYYSDRIAFGKSYKTARAGYVCAIIGTFLSSLLVVYYIIYLAFFVSISVASGGKAVFYM